MADKRKDNKGRNLKPGESQRADGRYMYRYTSLDGKRKCIYSWELATLREQEKGIQRDLDDGICLNAQLTLNKLIEEYLATKTKLALSTKENYIYIWEKDIKNSPIGKRRINDITVKDIKMFYASLSNKGFKNGTLQLYQNFLYPCFQLAVDSNLIRTNPCKNCMKEYLKKDATKKDALTIAQQEILLKYVSESKMYNVYLPLITFMLGTCCRCSETIGMTWNDVDMKTHLVDVNHQVTYKCFDGVTKHRVMKPKTEDGNRIIPMTKEVYQALVEQRKMQLLLGIDRNIEVDGLKGFIFTTRAGKPYQPNCINRALDNIVKGYNKQEEKQAISENREPTYLPHISAHSLRHTGCTRLAENGIDVKALQYIMGHANISVTMDIYNHIDTTRVVSEMQKAEGIFKIG